MRNNPFPLLVAEIANTHAGNYRYLLESVRQIAETTADAAKFQIIFTDELVAPNHSMYDLFKSYEFPESVWFECVELLRAHGKKVAMDIFGNRSLELTGRLKPDFIKIHATDFDNLSFIRRVFDMGLPVYLNTGGANQDEIDRVADIARETKTPICLQVGFQAYPTPVSESHLNRIDTLQQRYNCTVGLADHVRGTSIFAKILPCLAVSKGAGSIEKHVMLPERETKTDWQAAIPVLELSELREALEDTLLSFGQKDFQLSHAEQKYRDQVRKKILSTRRIQRGEILTMEDTVFLRGEYSGQETPLIHREVPSHLGKAFVRDAEPYTVLTREMFAS